MEANTEAPKKKRANGSARSVETDYEREARELLDAAREQRAHATRLEALLTTQGEALAKSNELLARLDAHLTNLVKLGIDSRELSRLQLELAARDAGINAPGAKK